MPSTFSLRVALAASLFMAAFSAMADPVAAQSTGTVRGRVVEANTTRPLGSVQVFIQGTNRGGLTNAAGEFMMLNVPAGRHTLRAEMVGYAPAQQEVTVEAGQVVTVEFTLSLAAIALDEVVVTGVPGATQRRTLGNAVTSINAADLAEKVGNSNITELLQSKAPGVQVIGGAGTAGAGSNIRIRGASSLNAGNSPVFYVDGVRISTARAGNFLTSCCNQNNGQNANLLDILNPEDIESIEVIKGPAAATLYGAEAASGVIQIITKKGRPGEQTLQWNAKIEMGQSEWAAETITNHAICTAEKLADPDTYPGCAGKAEGTIIRGQPLKTDPNALRAGDLQKYSLSVRGGGEGYSFYVSGDLDEEEGIFHNNFNNRKSARANFSFFPRSEFDFTVNVSYIQSHTRFPLGDEHAQGILFSAARSEPGRMYPAPGGLGWWQRTPDLSNRFDNQTRAQRVILGATVNYRPLRWFTNRLTVGIDHTGREAEIFYPPFDPAALGPDSGFIAQRRPDAQLYTVDYAGTINTNLNDAVSSTLSFGMQFNATRYREVYAEGSVLGSPVTRTVNAAARTSGSQSYSETNSVGFFAQEQIGWRDRLFVTAGLRMDNNSVFGDDIKRIFYPKVSASYVISEEDFFNIPAVDNLRLRAAWGQAGNAPGAYSATRTYTSSVATTADGGSVPALRLGAYGNPDLKPERGDEIELGLDATFFGNRAGIELTYYRKHLKDGLLPVTIPPSSGFSGSILRNLLETKNSGFELSLTGTPIEGRTITWESRINLATNTNELVTFGDDRSTVPFGLYAAVQWHRPGYPLAGFWARDVVRDTRGAPVLDDNGRVQVSPDTVYVGPSTPTREASFANTITLFRNLRLFALLDYKAGHYMFNVTDWFRYRNSLTYFMVDPNADPIQKQVLSHASVTRPWIQPADFLKLRDVSLTYTLPADMSRRFGSDRTSLTITGHNLGILWSRYGGIDPEVNLHGDSEFLRAQAYTVPQTRRISAALNVSF